MEVLSKISSVFHLGKFAWWGPWPSNKKCQVQLSKQGVLLSIPHYNETPEYHTTVSHRLSLYHDHQHVSNEGHRSRSIPCKLTEEVTVTRISLHGRFYGNMKGMLRHQFVHGYNIVLKHPPVASCPGSTRSNRGNSPTSQDGQTSQVSSSNCAWHEFWDSI